MTDEDAIRTLKQWVKAEQHRQVVIKLRPPLYDVQVKHDGREVGRGFSLDCLGDAADYALDPFSD